MSKPDSTGGEHIHRMSYSPEEVVERDGWQYAKCECGEEFIIDDPAGPSGAVTNLPTEPLGVSQTADDKPQRPELLPAEPITCNVCRQPFSRSDTLDTHTKCRKPAPSGGAEKHETITIAAIRQAGVVYTGRRHDLIIRDIAAVTGERLANDSEQGFVTSAGRYVGRKAAYLIAAGAGQIEWKLRDKQLYSEDFPWSGGNRSPEALPNADGSRKQAEPLPAQPNEANLSELTPTYTSEADEVQAVIMRHNKGRDVGEPGITNDTIAAITALLRAAGAQGERKGYVAGYAASDGSLRKSIEAAATDKPEAEAA